jgi:hypothetical protein
MEMDKKENNISGDKKEKKGVEDGKLSNTILI